MKTLAKLKNEPGLWLWKKKIPTIAPNELLIKIKKTAICGTDIHIYNWNNWASQAIPVPMTIGHEYIGSVVNIGKDVLGFSIGDRVSGEGIIGCEQCRNCRSGSSHLCADSKLIGINRSGAFAEYLALPARNAFKIPPFISDDIGAILDPLGNAVHTALSFDLVGEDIIITGAGPIGIMSAIIARYLGARNIVITDINEYRLQLAKQAGVDYAINITKMPLKRVIDELSMQEGFGVGFEMSGSQTALDHVLDVMAYGGKIALLGLLPDKTIANWSSVITKGLTIKGIRGREIFTTWYKMINMLNAGLKVDSVITHHFKIAEYEQAFEKVLSGQSGKVILDWENI